MISKNVDEIVLKCKYSRRNLSEAESERTVACSDVARWISAARPSDGKTAEFSAGPERTDDMARRPIIVYLIERLKYWTFDDHFYPDVLKAMFLEVIILVVASLR